jgi:hypothetical protein
MLPAAMVSTVIKTVAQVEHLRWTKVKEVWTKLEAGYDAGNIPDALDEYLDVQDGRTGNSELQIEMQSLVAAHYGMIDTFIQDDLIQESIPVTASSVQSIIRDKLQIDVSQRTCSRVLKRLGYRYGKLRKQMLLTRTRKLRIRKFLMDYARAKKLEAAGTHIIVNMDESFVHTRHARTMGYHLGREAEGIVNNAFLHNTDDGRQGESTDSRGQRLIFLHAMTKDGLLFGDAAQKARGISETAIGTDYENAEWVFQADARVKDYHKTAYKFQVRAEVEMNRWIELHGGDVGLSGTVGDLTDTGVPGDAADNACSGGDSDVEDGDYADDGMGDAAAELDD